MKKLICILGVLVLFVPAFFSAKFYLDVLNEERERERLTEICVTPDGSASVSFLKGDERSEKELHFLSSLGSLSDRSLETYESLVKMTEESDLSKDNPRAVRFGLKYVTSHKEYTADLFVVDRDRSGSYVVYFAYDGSVFVFDDDRKTEFLSLGFAYSVNEEAEIPVVIFGDSEYDPYTLTWKVKNANGEISDVEYPGGKEHYIGAYIDKVSFSVLPDEVSVKITDKDKNELASGALEKLSSFTPKRSGEVYIEIRAIWYQKSDTIYSGSAVYLIKADTVADPSYLLDTNEVFPGYTVLLSCRNIPSDSIVAAAIGERTVSLYRQGEDLFSIIAFPYDEEPGVKTLVITVGGDTQKLNITVLPKTYKTIAGVPTRLKSEADFNLATSDEAMEEYKTLLDAVAGETSVGNLFSGRIADYQKSFSLYKGYGLFIPYESTGVTVRNDGVFFSASAGSIVEAMEGGRVCSVGYTPYLGAYVAVDHGYGLRTWYATLDEISVKVGDTVVRGDRIGRTGKGGIAPDGKMLVLVTVDNIAVCPYEFWEEDRRFPG